MKSWKYTFLLVVVILTILSLLLSACGPIDKSNGSSNKDKGNEKEKDNAKDGKDGQGGNANKITLCHKTGSAKKPYVEISVSVNATTDGHGTHDGDLIPAPEDGCPAMVTNPDAAAK